MRTVGRGLGCKVGEGIEGSSCWGRDASGDSLELGADAREFLIMSHVEEGASLDCPSLLPLSSRRCEGGDSMIAHHAEGVINSEGRQFRFKRSQLLQTGFFSSQRV